jgi:hypothetical protein
VGVTPRVGSIPTSGTNCSLRTQLVPEVDAICLGGGAFAPPRGTIADVSPSPRGALNVPSFLGGTRRGRGSSDPPNGTAPTVPNANYRVGVRVRSDWNIGAAEDTEILPFVIQ